MAKTILVLFVALTLGALACSGAKPLPKGPPPEYEDESVPATTPDAAAPAPTSPAALDASAG
jgi:hypothetical protein